MLALDAVVAKYGTATALWSVSLTIHAGELVCVVGPNGAGKTTLINVIAGIHRIADGAFSLDGADVSRLPPHRFCTRGIAIVPEGRRLFTAMTVRENLALGSYRAGAKGERRDELQIELSDQRGIASRLFEHQVDQNSFTTAAIGDEV